MLRNYCILFLILGFGESVLAQEQPNWWRSEQNVVMQLIMLQKDLEAWEAEISAREPKTLEDVYTRLNLALRVGDTAHARSAVGLLASDFREDFCRSEFLETFINLAMTFQSPEIARLFYESFPEYTCYPPNGDIFGTDDADWTDAEILTWLKARWEDAKCREISLSGPFLYAVPSSNVWFRAWFEKLDQMGLAAPERERLARAVRENPADISAVCTYLMVLYEYRKKDASLPDLAWVVEDGKYVRALDWYRVADWMKELELFPLQEKSLLRVMAGDLTAEEIRELSGMCQAVLPDETHRRMFALRVRFDLSKCSQALEKREDAQRWMLEANELSKKWNLPMDFQFAGQIQAFTGQRVIENEILSRVAEEPQFSEADPDYWYERAQYYRGRGESKELEHALRKGLALSEYEIPSQKSQKLVKEPQRQIWRTMFLSELAIFLKNENRSEEAAALLHSELVNAPEDACSVEAAMNLMLVEFPKEVDPEDPIYWTYLERRERWFYGEERLLRALLEKSQVVNEKHLAKAEALALADGADPSRAYFLGWVENRLGLADRSIPLLERAVRLMQEAPREDTQLLDFAAFTLFESYLDTRDVKRAEAIYFPLAMQHLTSREKASWLERLTDLARECGETEITARCEARLRNLSRPKR